MTSIQKLNIYTDGACFGNPGPGGVGIVLKYGNVSKEISKGYLHTTNNRMELMAVIEALLALKKDNLDIIVYSDSSYVVNAVKKGWLFNWIKKDFKGKKNQDLWMKFFDLYKKHNIEFKWIEGHAGHPENERCDILAKMGAQNPTLKDH